jgi:type IV secretion system protein VirB10
MAFGLMVILGAGMLTWYYTNAVSRLSRTKRDARAATIHKVQGEMPLPALDGLSSLKAISTAPRQEVADSELTPAVQSLTAERSQLPLMASQPGWVGPGSHSAYEHGAHKSAEQLRLERLLAGAAFAHDSGLRTAAALSDAPAVAFPTGFDAVGSNMLDALSDRARAAGSSGPQGAIGPEGAIGPLLRSDATPSARAKVLPTRRFLLAKGAFIDCTLETAIDSTLPGMTTCITATDTFGADGTVVLLERGTKLIGETRGQVQQGTARVFVLWTEARTPTGVVVPLDSPGTDELGRTGLPGSVNHHFWERFGAAILISTLDGAVQAAVQSASRGGGPIIYNPSGTENVLTDVLKNSINIRPTITKANGDRIQVFVARDVDFRSVYELRPVTAR